MSDNSTYEVYAIKYAETGVRTRGDSFIFDDQHDVPHEMDYSIWVIRNDQRTILVDTGFNSSEGARRDRPIIIEPAEALAQIGINPANIETVVVTHLHYDHAGGLEAFPQARFHLQEAEMIYATGPCMCYQVLQKPFTVEHVCQMVRRVYEDGAFSCWRGGSGPRHHRS